MATIEDFVLRMKVEGQGDIKQVSGTIKSLKDDIADLGQVGGPLGGTINGIVGKLGPMGVAASVAGAAFIGLGSRALQLAAELSDISGATGIAAGTLMNFRTSVIEAGGKAEDFGQIAAKLNQSVQEAASGNEAYQKSFQRLGVFVTDSNGKVRNTEDILRDVISKFRDGKISSEQYAAAIDILGKNINKLELAKLKAIADPIKDEQIRQIDKYNEAIDKMNEKFSNLAITIVGKVATAFNKLGDAMSSYDDKVTNAEKALNQRGLTSRPVSLPGKPLQQPIGSTGLPDFLLRKLTDEEKKYLEQQKRIAEQEKLMSNYRSREQSGGGYGPEAETARKAREEKEKAAREAREKALEGSVKRISQIEIEQGRQTDLTVNSERLAAILMFASEQEALEHRTQAQIKEIRINSDAEIAKAKLEIYDQELLTKAQKDKEYAAKQKEIRLKEVTDISKARNSLSEQLQREDKRIQDIITQSKARVEEETKLNELLGQRNKFVNENAAATDLERERAQQIFDLEQERLKVLRQIALIKDIPPEERLKREQEINTIFDQRREKTIQQQEADKRLTANFSAGFEKAYRQYAEDSRNAFERGARIFATFTKGMEDSIVSFVKTGKFNFMDLVNTLLEEILRAEIRLLASNIMGSMGGRSGGGGLAGLLGFANGGIIPTNGPVIVGERGPELLVGASGNRVIPNGQFGGGSVTYNINAVDAASFKSMIARDPGFIHAVAQQGAKTVARR